MKKTAYMAPAIITTEVELRLLDNASITGTSGDTDVQVADPNDPIPTTGQSRRKSVWDDNEEEDEFLY